MEVRYQYNKFRQTTIANDLNQLKRAFMYKGLWSKGSLSDWLNPSSAAEGDIANRSFYNVNTDLFISQTLSSGSLAYYLRGPNILALVRSHFKCPTAAGLQVLNQSDLANFLPNDLFSSQADSAGDSYDSYLFSQFDAAILKDMGNYEQINDGVADSIQWGYHMGCDFLQNSCSDLINSSISYNGNLYQCNQFSTGKFIQSQTVIQNQITSGQCPQINSSNTQSCLLSTSASSQDSLYGETYGTFSKCLISNVLSTSQTAPSSNPPIRCHSIQCDQSMTYITIFFPSGYSVVCLEPQEVLTVDTGSYQGTITCPDNFQQFCYSPSCPNNCNQNGFCQNGECQCSRGYTGDDCSIQCLSNNCTCDSPCVTCRGSTKNCTSCLSGYVLNQVTNTCIMQCDNSCQTCSQPLDNTQCLSCYDGYYLYQGLCLPCLSPCSTCNTTREKCTSCITGYSYNQNSNTCTPICYDSCQTCSIPYQSNACITCKSRYYLINTQECLICNDECLTCSGTASVCTSCYPGYYLDTLSGTCSPLCSQNCLTCTQAYDPQSCTSCVNNFYLNNNQCLDCLSITDFSTPIPTECQGLFILSPNCNSRCKVCLASDKNYCLTCTDPNATSHYCDCPSNTSFINGLCRSCGAAQFYDSTSSSCLKCHPSCQTCFGASQNQCLTCSTQNSMGLNSSTNTCSCINSNDVIVIVTDSNNVQSAVCTEGINVNFSRFYPNYLSQYQMFQAVFTIQLASSTQNTEIFNTFQFYIPEISSQYYDIQVDGIQDNQILFSIIPKKSFHATTLMITIFNVQILHSPDNNLLQPSLINKAFTLDIGPIFIGKSDNQNDGSGVSDQINTITNFVSYNKEMTSTINFLNQFSIFLHLINTIQPSALFITINTNLPPIFYTIQRLMGTFVYPNAPDQSVIRLLPSECKLSYLTIQYCDLENETPQSYNQFQRLGFSSGLFLNIQNPLNQMILGAILFFVSKYILEFYNEELSNIISLIKPEKQPVNEVRNSKKVKYPNSRNINNSQLTQLRRVSNMPFGFSNKKIQLIFQLVYTQSLNYFYSTLEANLLIISISMHLAMKVNIFDSAISENPLIRISLYIFFLTIAVLIFLLRKGYKSINHPDNEDEHIDNLIDSLKEKGAVFCRNFHLLNFGKKWLVCCLHVELYYYPKVLIIIIIAIYGFGILLEVIYRPFDKLYKNVIRIVGDGAFAFVYYCTLQTHLIYLKLETQTVIEQQDIYQFSQWGLIASFTLIGYNGLYLILYIINLFDFFYSKTCKNLRNKYREIDIQFTQKTTMTMYSDQKTKKSYVQKESNNFVHKETIDHLNNSLFDLDCSLISNSQFNQQYLMPKPHSRKNQNLSILIPHKEKQNKISKTQATIRTSKQQKANQQPKLRVDKYGNIDTSNLGKMGIPLDPSNMFIIQEQL